MYLYTHTHLSRQTHLTAGRIYTQYTLLRFLCGFSHMCVTYMMKICIFRKEGVYVVYVVPQSTYLCVDVDTYIHAKNIRTSGKCL